MPEFEMAGFKTQEVRNVEGIFPSTSSLLSSASLCIDNKEVSYSGMVRELHHY